VKYSHGKRLNYGQTDTWAVIQLFVVGLKSKPDYTTEMLLSLGGLDSDVRQKSLQRLRKHKAQQLAASKQDDNQVCHSETNEPQTQDHVNRKGGRQEE
jgi:hypothetical protein